jgi:hypothetical protein
MKKFWNESTLPDIVEARSKHGNYPGLWKEVLTWKPYKEVRKLYLKHSSTTTTSSSSSSDAPAACGDTSSSSIPRKRRSRWGSASQDDAGGDNGNNKRRSRWGDDPAGTTNNPSTAPAPAQPPTGVATVGTVNPTALTLPIPGLPTVSNLAPHQQEEMKSLQSRLRFINSKMENLEQEAARVDALPRGHRERSPSPPPSKYHDVEQRV